MKLLTTIFLVIICFSTINSQTNKKTAYIMFDADSKETYEYKHPDYDKKSKLVKKYFKKNEVKNIRFNILGEKFNFLKENEIDTCTTFDKNKFIDILYLIKQAKNTREFKHHIFKKIYILEKIECNKYLKYEVIWIDERFGIN